MIERSKSVLLTILVVLSLVQSYLLVYSYPPTGAIVRTEQEYITAERMGAALRIDQVLYPADMVLHMGGDRHTVIYPETSYFNRIYEQVTRGEYRNFQRIPGALRNWDELRRTAQGIEMRFGGGVPVALLQKVMQLEGDILFLNDAIDRIWLLKRDIQGRSMAEIYFFSTDGETVYMPIRPPLSADEIEDITGLGVYMPAYTLWRNDIYLPTEQIEAVAYTFGYTTFSPQQMQRSLFFDPDKTRYLEDRSGQVIYTDGKRGLQLESGDTWMVFTDPVPMQDTADNLEDNVLAALQFVNQHGGWDGRYRFVPASEDGNGRNIVFQQYYERYPLIGGGVRYGQVRLLMQQGTAVVYERSLINLGDRQKETLLRWLPGGTRLRSALESYGRMHEVTAVFPAQFVTLTEDRTLIMEPVWAVKLADGTVQMLMLAMPEGMTEARPMPPADRREEEEAARVVDGGQSDDDGIESGEEDAAETAAGTVDETGDFTVGGDAAEGEAETGETGNEAAAGAEDGTEETEQSGAQAGQGTADEAEPADRDELPGEAPPDAAQDEHDAASEAGDKRGGQ